MGYKRVPDPPANIMPFMIKDSWQLAVGSYQFLKTLQSSCFVFIEFIRLSYRFSWQSLVKNSYPLVVSSH
jgi:hypothetical protein